ncbi:MAG TPA: cytochrome c oxidase accessory protein CcoG [Thermodesulfobacteriota bacterium]|nr:cytochrome c oxidase accessory protein CcoG [Thermodesulfobacteriota bacterium]
MSEVIEKQEKIYPKRVKGRFRTIKWALSLVLLGIYFILPWIRLDGRQAVLFDIPDRKFYIFNIVFWPQDVFYLAILILLLAMGLFFFTAVAGRLWCGYVCPQTGFSDIFVAIERFIEGDRHKRIVLDQAPWSMKKVFEKITKHSAWLALSFAVSFTFVAYFVPPQELGWRIVSGNLTAAHAFWLFLFTAAMYSFCGFFKEWVCLVPCPYGRFQSTLCDQDTLIIGYDVKRGEPRGHVKKGEVTTGVHGDCTDCSLCVQVCPTGIDIRNGLQYECIGCAQCIDACNSVMKKIDKPQGLIRYGSLNIFSGGTTHILRPRVVLYASILVVLISGLFYKVATRIPLEIDVLRNRTSLYQKTSDGKILNIYTIKALNMDRKDHRFMIKVEGMPAKLVIGANPIQVKGGGVYQTTVSLAIDEKAATKKVSHFAFVIEDVDNPKIKARRESTFLAPVM